MIYKIHDKTETETKAVENLCRGSAFMFTAKGYVWKSLKHLRTSKIVIQFSERQVCLTQQLRWFSPFYWYRCPSLAWLQNALITYVILSSKKLK